MLTNDCICTFLCFPIQTLIVNDIKIKMSMVILGADLMYVPM